MKNNIKKSIIIIVSINIIVSSLIIFLLYRNLTSNDVVANVEYLTKYIVRDNSSLRVYYLVETDNLNRHMIIKTWNPLYGTPLPEENVDTMVNVPFDIVEINLGLNSDLVKELEGHIEQYYVNDKKEICKIENNIMQTILNPISNISNIGE